MDTPDRAASLADTQVADACNKSWLVQSARCNQISRELCRDRLEGSLSLSSKSAPSCTTNPLAAMYGSMSADNQKYRWSKDACTTINTHLYDNISFATGGLLHNNDNNRTSSSSPSSDKGSFTCLKSFTSSWTFNKFRLVLACYVLLGITLSNYSRNALSLAAVGMVANNELNRQLLGAASLAASGQGGDQSTMVAPANWTRQLMSPQPASLLADGSCPIVQQQQQQQQQPAHHTDTDLARIYHENTFRASIKRRVDQGDLVDWSPGEQGLIFAAGSLGNLLLAIPLTRLGEIYGPKWIIFVSSLGATLQAAFMPLVSPCHVSLVILFQIIFSGLTFGADCVAYTLFAHWLTPTELAFFVSCLLICFQTGTIMSSFITSTILTASTVTGGTTSSSSSSWPWCFYTPAILCAIWTLIWPLIGASEPSKSSIISREELLFLMKNSKISQAATLDDQGDEANDETSCAPLAGDHRPKAPTTATHRRHQTSTSISWLKLARDPNIWAIISIKFTLRWYFSVYGSLMPTYLSSVAHMSVGTIGKMGVVQSCIGIVIGVLMGYLTRSLVSRRPFGLSLAATRKLFQSIVNFGVALSLVLFIYYDCSHWILIASLTFGGICINFYCAGALQLPLDLSPGHCGLITSITNTLALGQALGAPISGWILNGGPKDRHLWRIVWLVCIGLNTLSGMIFLFLVDAKPRHYDAITTTTTTDIKANKTATTTATTVPQRRGWKPSAFAAR